MPYEFSSRVRYSEVGEDHRLTVHGIINYFQDCSTFQSEELGNGLSLLERRGRAWILAYWKLVIVRRPELGEQITAQTWATSMKGFLAQRNFRMLDAEGRTLAYADSLWTYLDVASGHPARMDQDVVSLYPMEEALPMGKMVRKVLVPEDCEERELFQIRRANLDTNHHVNNGQYIFLAREYLPEGFEPHEIRVEYRKAAVLHDEMLPLVKQENGKCTVALCDRERSPYAVVEFSEELPQDE